MRDGDARRGWRGAIAACSFLLSFPVAALVSDPAAAQFAAEAAPNPMGKMRLVKFQNSPFPFDGEIPEKGATFLDVKNGERRGHTSARGGVYWEDKTYSDRRALVAFPRGFDPAKPMLIVVYFHGNQAKLERDVYLRQHVPRQVVSSGRNTVLIAPQFAVDALDSSAGRFWEPGMFRAFLDEAAIQLAHVWGDERTKHAFASAPVVLVAYSGGYMPAAFALLHGDVDDRVQGIVLLDALYGETDKFLAWRARKPDAFIVSAYSKSTEGENASLQRLLRDENVRYETALPRSIAPGTIAFLTAPSAVHNDFVTKAWADDPLKLVLARVPRPTQVAPAPAVAAATPPDPNYVARMPRPRPASVIVPLQAPTMAATEVTATSRTEPETAFTARWPDREFDPLPMPSSRPASKTR